MAEEQKPRFEHITLHSGGAVPGIPGDHAPGNYIVDWQERRLVPIEEWNKLLAQLAEQAGTAKKTARTAKEA